MKSYKNAKVNPKAEMSAVKLISVLFSNLSILDTEAVRRNIEASCEGGMSISDRTIDKNKLDFIVDNFAFIEILLLGDVNFRINVRRCIFTEITLDEKKPDEAAKIRAKNDEDAVTAGFVAEESAEKAVINFSKYNDSVYNDTRDRIIKSFSLKAGSEIVINRLVSALSIDDKIGVSFCVSNFMYFLRAFSKNAVFAEWFKTAVNNFKRDNNILN